MAKKNLVTLKKIYVDKKDEKNSISNEEYKAQFIEVLYQWYIANKK